MITHPFSPGWGPTDVEMFTHWSDLMGLVRSRGGDIMKDDLWLKRDVLAELEKRLSGLPGRLREYRRS
jgi:hypothetical protein